MAEQFPPEPFEEIDWRDPGGDTFNQATDKMNRNARRAYDAVAVAGSGTYSHTQPTPSDVWHVAHNMGKMPSTIVVDSSGKVVFGSISHLSQNELEITFSAPFSGVAVCN